MFLKLSLVATSVLAVGIALLSASISRVLNSSHQMGIAAAATTVVPPSQPVNSLQCCNSALLPNTAPAVIAISSLLGLDVSGLNVRFGLVLPLKGTPTSDVFIRCANPDIGWGGLFAVNCVEV
ncbi:hypothetical protein C8J57DRAFT_1251099 [Mycena rebaudengoi]|nr:hypothetical protein C8J57DRAFT_1251099 [Mycena rebaudengoi]